MAGTSILQIILKVTKEGTGDKEMASATKELKGSLNDLGLGALGSITPLAAVAAAVTAVAAFTVDATNETIKYANEVRAMSQLTGQSAEESSRLLQVMDDMKVSTDTLTMATKTLSKQGLTMNIETLAKLSDEYNSLGNAADKTAFLVKNFGKSGLGMAEAMEKGGAALQSMNDEVSGSLVLNQKSVDAARQLEKQQDNLNDSWQAIKVTVGRAVIPALNDLLSAVNKNITKGLEWNDLLRLNPIGGFVMGVNDLKNAHDELNPTVDSATSSYTAWAQALEKSGLSAKDQALIDKDLADAAKLLSDGFKQQLSVIASMQSVEDSYAAKSKTNAEDRIQIEADKAAYIAQYGTWNVAKIGEFDKALADNSLAAQANAAEHDLASKKIILGMLEQQLSVDGLTKGEFEALLQQGKDWGIYTDSVIREAADARDATIKLAREIDSVPESKTIDITTNYYTNDYGQRAVNAAPGRAAGTNGFIDVPAGYPNDSYYVPMQSGEKYAVIPAGGSSIAGSGSGGSGGFGGDTYIFQFSPMFSTGNLDEIERGFTPMVRNIMRKVGAGG